MMILRADVDLHHYDKTCLKCLRLMQDGDSILVLPTLTVVGKYHYRNEPEDLELRADSKYRWVHVHCFK